MLGTEKEEETSHFNTTYISGLGKLADLKEEDVTPTEDDDRFAQQIIDNQNIAAILTAYMDHDSMSAVATSRSNCSRTRPKKESKVAFRFRSERREGIVKDSSTKYVTIEYSDGGRLVTKTFPIDYLEEEDPNPISASNAQAASTVGSNQDVPSPEMFDGERHRYTPTTTSICSVLTGLSSKNNETARQVLEEIISEYGPEEFYKAVHVVVADQEFMPTMINEFFSKLG